jgi:hypothetical protein
LKRQEGVETNKPSMRADRLWNLPGGIWLCAWLLSTLFLISSDSWQAKGLGSELKISHPLQHQMYSKSWEKGSFFKPPTIPGVDNPSEKQGGWGEV